MSVEENQKNNEDSDVVSFETLLQEIRAVNSKDRTKYLGAALNDDLKELMLAITKYNKSGRLVLTLDFQVAKESKEINIVPDIDLKKPKGKVTSNIMYRDDKGNIRLDDPELTKDCTVHKIR